MSAAKWQNIAGSKKFFIHILVNEEIKIEFGYFSWKPSTVLNSWDNIFLKFSKVVKQEFDLC